MAADFWPTFATGLGLVLAGSLVLEALLIPRPRLKGRPATAWAAHVGLCLLAYGLELVLFQRTFFGALAALSSLLLLVVVGNVKAKMLREPFLFQDFEYFTDLVRHPRLYLPFFGVGKALAGLAAFAGAVYVGMAAEPSLIERGGWGPTLAGLVLLAGTGAGLLGFAAHRPKPSLSFDPAADLQALGFLGYLWEYGLAEREPIPGAGNSPFAMATQGEAARPDLVVVQSESFFDARRLCPDIAPEVTAAFDRIRQTALWQGLLAVPAWGANTVRTEFAFLSGLGPQDLGVHRFNPYRKLAGQGVPTLAGYLKALGYRTVCVHPYSPSFYRRDRVYPEMGFDEFVGIDAFSADDYCGPYVGDAAVGRVVRKLLAEAEAPLFVFAITMENHGPLHWESVAPGDEARLYTRPPPKGFDDLTVYLRHLENTGRMLAEIRTALEESPRKGWLCWYGDHVPIMPEVYASRGYTDGRTDYFIWRRGAGGQGHALDLRAEELSALLLAGMDHKPLP